MIQLLTWQTQNPPAKATSAVDSATKGGHVLNMLAKREVAMGKS